MKMRVGPLTLEAHRTPPPLRTYNSFAEALAQCDGYEHSDILDVVEAKTRVLMERPSNALSAQEEHAMLGILQTRKSNVRVLDFGGACGAHYFAMRHALPHIDLSWVIVETPAMAARARRLGLTAVGSLREALALGTPDLLFTSGTVNYMPQPYDTLGDLLAIKAPVFVWARGTLADAHEIYVQVSRLSANGPGPLPPSFIDRPVSYPFCKLSQHTVMQLLHGAYARVLQLDGCGFSVMCQQPHESR